MQIVESTFISLIVLAAVLSRGPFVGINYFFAVIPFGMMAAINLPAIGGTSLMTYDLVLLSLGAMLILRRGIADDIMRLMAPGQPGLTLLLFYIYAVFATMFFPRIFAGETEVFAIGRVAGQVGIVSRPLAPNGGNLSQLVRMTLAVMAFLIPAIVVMRQGGVKVIYRAMLIVSLVHAGLGVLDLLTQATGTSFLLEPIRTANYALTLGQRMAGLDRMIGGFPEASSYGYVSLGLWGYWLGYWFHNKGRSKLPGIMVLVFAFLVIRGTSSSAYVGGMLLIVVFAVMRLREMGLSQNGLIDRRLAAVGVCVVAVLPLMIMSLYMAYALSQGFADFIDRSLLNKLESDSGTERMGFNLQALRNFMDTWMLGAGLGSVRASNWIAAVLGTTGLIGLGLLVTYLAQLFSMSARGASDEAKHMMIALKMGMAGCLARALVVKGTPNLDFIFFAMAGFLSGLAINLMAKSRGPVSETGGTDGGLFAPGA